MKKIKERLTDLENKINKILDKFEDLELNNKNEKLSLAPERISCTKDDDVFADDYSDETYDSLFFDTKEKKVNSKNDNIDLEFLNSLKSELENISSNVDDIEIAKDELRGKLDNIMELVDENIQEQS